MPKGVSRIFYFLFIILITLFVILPIVRELLFFVANHCLFLVATIVVIALIIEIYKSLPQLKKIFFESRPLIYLTIIIYICIRLIVGYKISLPVIFNTLSPIKIIYEQSDQINKPSSSFISTNFRFPFWRSFWLRLWNDLPLRKDPFVRFYYPVNANFRYDSAIDSHKNRVFDIYSNKEALLNIHDRKEIICILKNLGNQALLLNSVESIALRREKGINFEGEFLGSELRIEKEKLILKKIKGLRNILNSKISEEPIILYPSEEMILFIVSPDIGVELLSVEIQVKYYDWPEQLNLFTYRQVDEVKFSSNLSRTLFARTVSYGN